MMMMIDEISKVIKFDTNYYITSTIYASKVIGIKLSDQ
jgi:hypothetical protein